jgi:hypothetical protein
MSTLGAEHDDKTEAKLREAGYKVSERGFFKRMT